MSPRARRGDSGWGMSPLKYPLSTAELGQQRPLVGDLERCGSLTLGEEKEKRKKEKKILAFNWGIIRDCLTYLSPWINSWPFSWEWVESTPSPSLNPSNYAFNGEWPAQVQRSPYDGLLPPLSVSQLYIRETFGVQKNSVSYSLFHEWRAQVYLMDSVSYKEQQHNGSS